MGDQVSLTLPLPVRMLEANPRVESALGQVAVARGPIIYCLEEADLPKGVAIAEVRLPRDARFTSRHDPDLLGGITVIETTARACKVTSWNGDLYRDLDRTELTAVPISLIPYFAWHNRGDHEMTVWLPPA